MENVNSNPTNLREHSPSENEWRQLPKDYWFYLYSGGCTQPHSVMRRTDGGCTAVCSSPWTYPGVEAEMRSIADRHNAALAASGTEAAPSIDEIGMGYVAYHIAKRALDEKWDAVKLGTAITKFVNDVWRERSAQAAASPEGEAREALLKLRSYNVDILAGRINYRPQDHIDVIDAALRQSAAPSGLLGTPSKLDGSMATASENAGVVMDAHRQIVKAEIAEARLDEALEIRKNFHGMADRLTFGNLMDFVKWLDKHVRELEHAVAMNESAPQKLPAAQPQRESEPRQCSCPIERCDGPKSANEYCTAHPPKQFERESEQLEQVAKLTDKILTELFTQYSGKEFKSFRHALRRTLEPIVRAALCPQTDSQEPR